jgi:mRNA interferase MazF
MKGKIVLVNFPFTDLSATKLRPALILHESDEDVIALFISSRVSLRPALSDLVISEENPAFATTGLKVASVIRFDKIATLSRNLVLGEIGEITPPLAEECNAVIHRFFRF